MSTKAQVDQDIEWVREAAKKATADSHCCYCAGDGLKCAHDIKSAERDVAVALLEARAFQCRAIARTILGLSLHVGVNNLRGELEALGDRLSALADEVRK